MFRSTLKQSVATLGVVAGLLAAAGPAGAQILDGPVLAKPEPQHPCAIKSATFRGEVIGLEPTVKAPANPMTAAISGSEMAAAVKAPANPMSVVFTSVSNVAALHGDATTIEVLNRSRLDGLAHVEVGVGMSEEASAARLCARLPLA